LQNSASSEGKAASGSSCSQCGQGRNGCISGKVVPPMLFYATGYYSSIPSFRHDNVE
jgi:hypothetical protein